MQIAKLAQVQEQLKTIEARPIADYKTEFAGYKDEFYSSEVNFGFRFVYDCIFSIIDSIEKLSKIKIKDNLDTQTEIDKHSTNIAKNLLIAHTLIARYQNSPIDTLSMNFYESALMDDCAIFFRVL